MVMAIWVIKLLTPRLNTFLQTFRCSRKADLSRWQVLNRGRYSTDTTKEATWPMTVAMAAPRTPIPSAKIKIGSKIVLMTAPSTMENMANLGLPSARIMALSAVEIMVKGRPMAMT